MLLLVGVVERGVWAGVCMGVLSGVVMGDSGGESVCGVEEYGSLPYCEWAYSCLEYSCWAYSVSEQLENVGVRDISCVGVAGGVMGPCLPMLILLE